MSHLRIVKDEEAPRAKRRRGTRPPPALTPSQEQTAKAAIRGLATRRYGSLAKMSKALGYQGKSLSNMIGARGRITGDLVTRVALACSIPVETLVTPGPREAVAS